LNHPYFEGLHDSEDEPRFEGQLDFKFEYDQKISLDELRAMILEEVNYYKTQNNEPLHEISSIIEKSKKKRESMVGTDQAKKQKDTS